LKTFSWYLQALAKTFDFKGRASRSEYWYYQLYFVLFFIFFIFFDNFIVKDYEGIYSISAGVFLISFKVFSFIPSFTVTARRIHDCNETSIPVYFVSSLQLLMVILGYSGNNILLGFGFFMFLLIVIVTIWIFSMTLRKTDPDTNEYGEPPSEYPFSD